MVRAIKEGCKVLQDLGVPITPSNHKVFNWIPMNWRGVWVGLGALVGLALILIFVLKLLFGIVETPWWDNIKSSRHRTSRLDLIGYGRKSWKITRFFKCHRTVEICHPSFMVFKRQTWKRQDPTPLIQPVQKAAWMVSNVRIIKEKICQMQKLKNWPY